MQRLKLTALIILAVFAVPAALIALYVAWVEFDEWRFYQRRPIVGAMWIKHQRARDGSPSLAAEETLLRSFPAGFGRTAAAAALSAEGFHCQETRVHPGAIDCQIRAPRMSATRFGLSIYVQMNWANFPRRTSQSEVSLSDGSTTQ